MLTKLFLALLLALPIPAQDLAPAFPTAGATQLIDNERATVWEITVPKGKQITLTQTHPPNMVGIELADATVKATAANGSSKTASVRKGQVFFKAQGSRVNDQPFTYLEESVSDTLRRVIFVDLKDTDIKPLKNASGFPDAFPRESAKKLLENDHVIIWDYTWQLGKPTPMHFHTLDTVTVALENGEVRSTTADGQSTVNSNSFGLARFNPRARTHTEELIKGAARAIIVELK